MTEAVKRPKSVHHDKFDSDNSKQPNKVKNNEHRSNSKDKYKELRKPTNKRNFNKDAIL
jgi:hypothetical protein